MLTRFFIGVMVSLAAATVDAPMVALALPLEAVRAISADERQSLVTPIAFDCSKATLGVDYVICADPRLIEAESRLEDAYRSALAAQGDGIKKEEREWSRNYGPKCGLPEKGEPALAVGIRSHDCVAKAISNRIVYLKGLAGGAGLPSAQDQRPSVNLGQRDAGSSVKEEEEARPAVPPNHPPIGGASTAPRSAPSMPRSLSEQPNRATQTIIAQGLGKDVESAAKNAAENALTQVVGTFIQSDKILNKRTEIDNGIRQESRSIDTKTREYSQGSIKGFELLETSEDNGLTRVSARVDVRIEDFKAFVAKLAEGETTVEPGIFAQVATQAEKKENAKDIIVNNVLMPIMEGKALEFNIGKPQIYSEWEHGAPQQSARLLRELMLSNKAPRETIIVPVEIKINSAFLQNARQTLDSIAFEKKRVDIHSFKSPPCWTVGQSIGFDWLRDGFIAISSNTSLTDMYFFKDVAGERSRSKNSFAGDVMNEAFSDAEGFLYRHAESSFPELLVSLLGSEGVINEYLVTRHRGSPASHTSSDSHVFTDIDWIGWGGANDNAILKTDYSGYPKTCLLISPNSTMHLFLNIPPDQLSRVKTIKLKLQSK